MPISGFSYISTGSTSAEIDWLQKVEIGGQEQRRILFSSAPPSPHFASAPTSRDRVSLLGQGSGGHHLWLSRSGDIWFSLCSRGLWGHSIVKGQTTRHISIFPYISSWYQEVKWKSKVGRVNSLSPRSFPWSVFVWSPFASVPWINHQPRPFG